MPVAVPVVAATAFAGTAKRALCKAERVKEGFMKKRLPCADRPGLAQHHCRKILLNVA
jgi:hypothetical protein